MADEINPRIKRADGYFTTETAVEQRKRTSLCDQCARSGYCDIWATVSRINAAQTAIVPIKVCRDFQPFLPFQSERGLRLPRYNTFRMGSAFFGRFYPGLRLVLFNSVAKRAIGLAEVESMDCGPLRDMTEKHGALNHVLIEEKNANYSDRMFEVLRRSYGKLFVDWDRMATVIYLNWIGDDTEATAKTIHH